MSLPHRATYSAMRRFYRSQLRKGEIAIRRPKAGSQQRHSNRPAPPLRVDVGFATYDHVMSSRPVDEQRLRDLKLLRKVRDRMDRDYAQPLNVEALARGVNMSAGHLSRQFKSAYGESPYSY